MPRGYLKHQCGISRKVARGSGSHFSYRKDPGCWWPLTKETRHGKRIGARAWDFDGCTETNDITNSECVSDSYENQLTTTTMTTRVGRMKQVWVCTTCTFANDKLEYLACAVCGSERSSDASEIFEKEEDPKVEEKSNNNQETGVIGTCPICCEDGEPLIHLTKACEKRHEPACYECLRRLYVTDAGRSVAKYPLRCYHPSCQSGVREVQLTQFGLVKNKSELKHYFRFMELAKGHRGRGRGGIDAVHTAHCPNCDHPRTFKTHKTSDNLYRLFTCKDCGLKYLVPEFEDLIQVLEDMPSDNMGRNDGWAQCPCCKALISKGDGCDHMHCSLCRWDFSWIEAQACQLRFAT